MHPLALMLSAFLLFQFNNPSVAADYEAADNDDDDQVLEEAKQAARSAAASTILDYLTSKTRLRNRIGREDPCHLPADSGPCLAYGVNWYFDWECGACKTFVYGLCDGNANRFGSADECARACREYIKPDPFWFEDYPGKGGKVKQGGKAKNAGAKKGKAGKGRGKGGKVGKGKRSSMSG